MADFRVAKIQKPQEPPPTKQKAQPQIKAQKAQFKRTEEQQASKSNLKNPRSSVNRRLSLSLSEGLQEGQQSAESSSSNKYAQVANPQMGDNEVELSSCNLLEGTDDEMTEGDESQLPIKKHATDIVDSDISTSLQQSSKNMRQQMKMKSQQNIHSQGHIANQ